MAFSLAQRRWAYPAPAGHQAGQFRLLLERMTRTDATACAGPSLPGTVGVPVTAESAGNQATDAGENVAQQTGLLVDGQKDDDGNYGQDGGYHQQEGATPRPFPIVIFALGLTVGAFELTTSLSDDFRNMIYGFMGIGGHNTPRIAYFPL